MLVRHLIRSSALLLLCMLPMLPHRLDAQSTTSLLPDAAVLPSQGVRFRVLTGFTRYDAFLGNGGHRNIGAIVAADSLGVARIPSFSAAELGIREASGIANFILNLGTVTAPANSRIVTAPLIIEYGLTSRIQLGVVVPLVETRTTVVPRLNGNTPVPMANVGPNPVWFKNPTLIGANAAVIGTLDTAAVALQARLNACVTTPSDAGCSALLGQQGSVQSLITNTHAFAAALAALYGVSVDSRGQQYVPLRDSPTQAIIDQRVKDFATQLGGFLGTGVVLNQHLSGAQAAAGLKEFDDLLAEFGRDTVGSTDHSSIGDISIGASVNLLNSFGDTTGTSFFHPQYRFTVNGTFRIGTGQPASRNRAFDVATGYGQNGITAGAALDLRFGNLLSGSAVGSYTAQLGGVNVSRVPAAGNVIYPLMVASPGTFSAGNVTQLALLPRIRLAGYFALTGQYSLLRTDADRYTLDPSPLSTPAPPPPYGFAASTAQQIGFGFAYSTIVGPNRRSGAIPFEVSYNHVETIAGSGGPVYKTFDDRVELKVYFHTRRK